MLPIDRVSSGQNSHITSKLKPSEEEGGEDELLKALLALQEEEIGGAPAVPQYDMMMGYSQDFEDAGILVGGHNQNESFVNTKTATNAKTFKQSTVADEELDSEDGGDVINQSDMEDMDIDPQLLEQN